MGEFELLETQKASYINNETWILSFGGGFQRANVYACNVDENKRLEFRTAIREKVTSIVFDKYCESTVSSNEHLNVLVEIKYWIDNCFSSILRNGEIKFGVVQKLVNLYLKYQWCMDLAARPPHCPFDRIIIAQLKLKHPPNWTEINDIETYKMLVEKTTKLAAPKSIAEWELSVYSRR